MYKVIGHPRTRTMRVYWMLEELGQEYEIIIAPAHSAAATAANPSGKIPALDVDGTIITDSVAIMQFLADRHGALTHACGTLARATQDSFTQFAVDEMDAVLWNVTKHRNYHPKAVRIPGVIDAATLEFAKSMETLATRLGDNEFVMGDQISVPDLVLSHCAGWAKAAGFELPEGKLGDYFKRMRSRRALRKAMAKTAKLT